MLSSQCFCLLRICVGFRRPGEGLWHNMEIQHTLCFAWSQLLRPATWLYQYIFKGDMFSCTCWFILLWFIRSWNGSAVKCRYFVLKIKSSIKCLPVGVRGSLYVDDWICFRSESLIANKRQIHWCLSNRIQNWADENWYKFSKSKTVCIHFFSAPLGKCWP